MLKNELEMKSDQCPAQRLGPGRTCIIADEGYLPLVTTNGVKASVAVAQLSAEDEKVLRISFALHGKCMTYPTIWRLVWVYRMD